MANYNKDDLLEIIRKVAKGNNFSDNVQITLQRGSEKCDGFMGEILAIDVTDEETKNTLQLVAKISLKDERCRSYTVLNESYVNEIIAYEEFFPAIQELRRQFKLPEEMQALVKFYYASRAENEEILIMENIKKLGFQMRPIKELLDDEHVNLVFKYYAELHANSFALKTLRPQKFEEMASKNVNVFRAMLDMKMGSNFVKHLISIRKAMKMKGFKHFLLDKYAEDTIGILRKILDFSDEKYTCFTHGDSWSNNMMFRYEVKDNKQTLTDLKLLDWQGWSVSPPAVDLMFCLYSSCSKDVLDNIDTHLSTYHAHLANILASYKLDVEKIYPFPVLKKQIEKYFHFPAMIGVMIRKIRSFSEDHNVDPVNFTPEDDSTHFEAALTAEYDVDFLLEQVKDLFDHIDHTIKGEYTI